MQSTVAVLPFATFRAAYAAEFPAWVNDIDCLRAYPMQIYSYVSPHRGESFLVIYTGGEYRAEMIVVIAFGRLTFAPLRRFIVQKVKVPQRIVPEHFLNRVREKLPKRARQPQIAQPEHETESMGATRLAKAKWDDDHKRGPIYSLTKKQRHRLDRERRYRRLQERLRHNGGHRSQLH